MAASLTGSTALITGATAGIGRAVARQLAERGAEVVSEIEAAGGRARFLTADLHDADDVRRLAADAGPVDILVNNAGIYRFGTTAETDDAFFTEQIDVNLRAPFLLVQALAPGMVTRGRGTIVNVSTLAATVPARTGGIYGASKAALELLTRVWADEFGPAGVRVNAVAPGPTYTPGTEDYGPMIEALGRTTALGRPATPDEIAS